MAARTHHLGKGFIAGLFALGLAQSAGANPLERLRVNVLLQDNMGLADEVVNRAKQVVNELYEDINIEVLWAPPAQQVTVEGNAQLMAFWRTALRIDLTSAPTERTVRPLTALGVAFPNARMAWVLTGRIKDDQSSYANDVAFADRLGYVMAHELGHLLGGSHTITGVMATRMQWRAVAQHALWFTAGEATRIRHGSAKSAAGRAVIASNRL